MGIHVIDTFEDERLDVYARLTDVQLRSRLEPEKGIFIAESSEVIGRAVDAGMRPLSLLVTDKLLIEVAQNGLLDRLESAYRASNIQDACISESSDPLDPWHLAGSAGSSGPLDSVSESTMLPVFVAPGDLLGNLTGFQVTRGALAAFRRPPLPCVQDVLQKAHLVVVLEDIRNHTNVGAAFRSAAALGADAVLVTPACYDPFYRRAIRVSMGTVFQVPWAHIGSDPHNWAEEGVPVLHDAGFSVVALALQPGALTLDDPRLHELDKIALVFGTEGDGLAASTLAACDYTARIPMAHGVDSLNVAASSAVALWEFTRSSSCDYPER